MRSYERACYARVRLRRRVCALTSMTSTYLLSLRSAESAFFFSLFFSLEVRGGGFVGLPLLYRPGCVAGRASGSRNRAPSVHLPPWKKNFLPSSRRPLLIPPSFLSIPLFLERTLTNSFPLLPSLPSSPTDLFYGAPSKTGGVFTA